MHLSLPSRRSLRTLFLFILCLVKLCDVYRISLLCWYSSFNAQPYSFTRHWILQLSKGDAFCQFPPAPENLLNPPSCCSCESSVPQEQHFSGAVGDIVGEASKSHSTDGYSIHQQRPRDPSRYMNVSHFKIKQLQYNAKNVYTEVSPSECSGTYFPPPFFFPIDAWLQH